jgi:ectoine hydroxylase-related dioxygenase (phytanoyl-CoA dioxygenase family)
MKIKKILQKFNEDGFVIIPKFLNKANIKEIFFQLNELIDVPINNTFKNNETKKNLDEKYLLLKKKNPSLKSHFYDMIKYIDAVNKVSVSKKFLSTAKKLLNEKTTFTGNHQVRIDHAEDSYWLPQHQELGQLSTNLITFWIPLVDLEKKLGGIYIRPKTHKLGFFPYKNSDKEGREAGTGRKKIIDQLFSQPHLKKYKSFRPKLRAGDAVVFHNYLFHGTIPNLNRKKIRWVFISRYNSINKTPYLKDGKASMNIPYTANYGLL